MNRIRKLQEKEPKKLAKDLKIAKLAKKKGEKGNRQKSTPLTSLFEVQMLAVELLLHLGAPRPSGSLPSQASQGTPIAAPNSIALPPWLLSHLQWMSPFYP